MKKVKYKFLVMAILFVIPMVWLVPVSALAEGSAAEEQKYYLGSAVNAGTDTGYSESNDIKENDPHFGWELGRFYISGYTRVTKDESGNPVFLKNVGDEVGMYYVLEQDIDNLYGNANYSIADDSNGFDSYFGVQKTDFGRGMLIVRKTDYQNNTEDPVLYQDFLTGVAEGSDTNVDLYEEGDYEVALDYELENNPRKVPFVNLPVLPEYYNYQVFFRFSIRNGNCMVFPFDVVTGDELTNSAVTENGFRIDLAKSRYLDTNIKREVLAEGADGLTEDTRYNRPAKDGEEYTEEGVYTITVSNRYTAQETTKKIYVGTNDILKAYAATGLPISEIRGMIAAGAKVQEDGSIVSASGEKTNAKSTGGDTEEASAEDSSTSVAAETTDSSSDVASVEEKASDGQPLATIPLVIGAVVLGAAVILLVIHRRRESSKGDSSKSSVDDALVDDLDDDIANSQKGAEDK